MSNTRRAKSDSTFHQEKFASSDAYAKPLLGNMVAKRAKAIADPEDRALIYFLQQLSHRDGGLEKVASDLLESFSDRIGTPSMHKIGEPKGGLYSAEQVRAIRSEMPGGEGKFPLFGEYLEDRLGMLGIIDPALEMNLELQKQRAEGHPAVYPVTMFRDDCEDSYSGLADHLRALCLNPEIDLQSKDVRWNSYTGKLSAANAGVWWFEDLIGALHDYRRQKIEQAAQRIASTAISRKVYEDLEYALETRSLVIVEGLERMGKSVTAQNFCERHPGQAIYVRLESGGDDMSLFRTIAKAVGTATATRKAAEIKHRIEDMLQEAHLMLVIDEAHFLFPQAARVQRGPSRIDWLRTALVDFGVPVALISTPQFDKQCDRFEKLIGWNARQIKGRVALHTILPPELEEEDLKAIARHLVPEADREAISILSEFAAGTEDYVAGIERIVKRARWFGRHSGEALVSIANICRAVEEVIPPKPKPLSAPEASEDEDPDATAVHDDLNRISEPLKSRFTPPTFQKTGARFSQKSAALSHAAK